MIRKALASQRGIADLRFNLLQRTLTVAHDLDDPKAILDTIRSLGFEPELCDTIAPATSPAPERNGATFRACAPLLLALALALAAEVVSWFDGPWFIAVLSALAALTLCGLATFRKGWLALRHGDFNINALMSLAVTGALVLGHWSEAAMVMVLFTVAERLEAGALDRARRAVERLLQLAPDTVTAQQSDNTWQTVPARDVPIGARVRVHPGERIALDGEIVSGTSAVNQSAITGESLPVEKAPGDPVFAGTLNESGVLEYRTQTRADGSLLARIVRTVEEAQNAKAPTQRFIDRFARIYTPAVITAAVLTAALPPLLFGMAWQPWLYKALVLLVIACPCALVISTPVTIVSALTRAARMGLLVKGGAPLEKGRSLRWLALDKTGTLTHGAPQQTDAVALADVPLADCQTLAASLAALSRHPVSRAVAAATVSPLLPVTAFADHPGSGISGVIDGKRHTLGRARQNSNVLLAAGAQIETLERQGKTVVLLCRGDQTLALFAVADTLRPHSRDAIVSLQRLGIHPLMLTGDNAHTAAAIAAQAGIGEVRSALLPQGKCDAIVELKTRNNGGAVGMIGDGINDAPALASADLSFAMGAIGSDVAIDTADVAIMDDDLRKLPRFVRLSRAAHAVLVQNIVFALAVKGFFFALALAGISSLWMAVFADVGASLIVIANGMRLLRERR